MKVMTVFIALAMVMALPLAASGQKEEAPMEKEMMAEKAEMETVLMDFSGADKAMMLADTAPTVLFFHASWCPSCKAGEKDINMNGADLEGINVIKVDYDNSEELQKKYGITSQHTFVQIDAMGEALAKWNGGGSAEILENIVKKDM
ncbi:MAG: thioredoxin family protein [Spirochaetales bacterium]|nr:thioredoxin family protein [Spirochaetales bacterium]